jgi:hypothetical protein
MMPASSKSCTSRKPNPEDEGTQILQMSETNPVTQCYIPEDLNLHKHSLQYYHSECTTKPTQAPIKDFTQEYLHLTFAL